MKMQIDLVTKTLFDYSFNTQHILHDDFVQVSLRTVSEMRDRVKSKHTVVVALPGVILPNEAFISDTVITCLYHNAFQSNGPFSIEDADIIRQCILSKGIACSYDLWKDLPEHITSGKRHIDLSNCFIPHTADYAVPSTELDDNFSIHYYGKRESSFGDFLRSHMAGSESRRDLVFAPYAVPYANSFRRKAVAIIPTIPSSLFLHTLCHHYPLVIYPVTGSNGSVISGLDVRGGSSTLASVATIEFSGLGRSKATQTSWKEMMTDISFIIQSVVKYPYMVPVGEHFVRRLFNEINRSGF